jgi:hypothetical protein
MSILHLRLWVARSMGSTKRQGIIGGPAGSVYELVLLNGQVTVVTGRGTGVRTEGTSHLPSASMTCLPHTVYQSPEWWTTNSPRDSGTQGGYNNYVSFQNQVWDGTTNLGNRH